MDKEVGQILFIFAKISQTKPCDKLKINVIVKTLFDYMNFVSDTVADSDQTDFEQLKNSYSIVEV